MKYLIFFLTFSLYAFEDLYENGLPDYRIVENQGLGSVRYSSLNEKYQIGRVFDERWKLTLTKWKGSKLEIVKLLTDHIIYGKDFTIKQAYDPEVVNFNSKTFVLFECSGKGLGPASICIAKFSHSRGILVNIRPFIKGIPKLMSASVPKAIVFNKKVYVYWTMVKFGIDRKFKKVYTRGMQVDLDKGSYSTTNGVNVWDGKLADMFDITVNNGVIYAVGGVGKCVYPVITNNCYMLAISKAYRPISDFGKRQILLDDRTMNYSTFITLRNGKIGLLVQYIGLNGLFLYDLE